VGVVGVVAVPVVELAGVVAVRGVGTGVAVFITVVGVRALLGHHPPSLWTLSSWARASAARPPTPI